MTIASALFDVLQPVQEPLDDLRGDPDFVSKAVVGRMSPIATRSAAAARDEKAQGLSNFSKMNVGLSKNRW